MSKEALKNCIFKVSMPHYQKDNLGVIHNYVLQAGFPGFARGRELTKTVFTAAQRLV